MNNKSNSVVRNPHYFCDNTFIKKRFNTKIWSSQATSNFEEETNDENNKANSPSGVDINRSKPKAKPKKSGKTTSSTEDSKSDLNVISAVSLSDISPTKTVEGITRKRKRKQKGDSTSKTEPMTDKERSAKKTRLKNKFLEAVKVMNKVSDARVPIFIINCIRTAKLELIDLDRNQQKLIIELAGKLSKEELAIMFLLIPNTAEELKFLKNIFLTKQYMDNLFRNIDYKLIQ